MTTPTPTPLEATARAIADAHMAGQPITELVWELTRHRRAELAAPPTQATAPKRRKAKQ